MIHRKHLSRRFFLCQLLSGFPLWGSLEVDIPYRKSKTISICSFPSVHWCAVPSVSEVCHTPAEPSPSPPTPLSLSLRPSASPRGLDAMSWNALPLFVRFSSTLLRLSSLPQTHQSPPSQKLPQPPGWMDRTIRRMNGNRVIKYEDHLMVERTSAGVRTLL